MEALIFVLVFAPVVYWAMTKDERVGRWLKRAYNVMMIVIIGALIAGIYIQYMKGLS